MNTVVIKGTGASIRVSSVAGATVKVVTSKGVKTVAVPSQAPNHEFQTAA